MAKRTVVQHYFGAEFAAENSAAHGTECRDVSLARQSEQEDADINTIVRRFGITGTMPRDLPPLLYGDFTEVGDYQSAFAAVADAQERFMAMPAAVRERFANDPQKFLEFCENKDNKDEMKKMGLLVPDPEVKAPIEVIVKNAVTAPPQVHLVGAQAADAK